MNIVGVVRTDDLPSTSIGLRALEMRRLGFSAVVLYAKNRVTVARQFRSCLVATDAGGLEKAVSSMSPDFVMTDQRCPLDRDVMSAIGVPGDNEARCIVGHRFVGVTTTGSRNVIKVFEYDRRKGCTRHSSGDSGDVSVDSPDVKSPVLMTAGTFYGMLSCGDGFLRDDDEFREAADRIGASVVCSDPIAHGVKWHASVSDGEKKPVNVVYGEKISRIEKAVQKAAAEVRDEVAAEADEPDGRTGTAEAGEAGYSPTAPAPVAPLPPIAVIVTTHNRTRIARAALESLVRNLNYSGGLVWCICDDRSESGHVQSLEGRLRSLGVPSGSIRTLLTSDTRYGLGASLNAGLSFGFSVSDVVLTTEDDWILERPLNLAPFARTLMSDGSVGMIRLAALGNANRGQQYDANLVQVVGSVQRPSVMNNQVALRHRRMYEFLGGARYPENCTSDHSENSVRDLYNRKTNFGRTGMKVLVPSSFEMNTLDHPSLYFIHVGKSTVGHDSYFSVPLRYRGLYDEGKVVATMTSYPKRISNVARSMILLMDGQTRPPDEIHLYLSKDEFELYENSLPEDLRNVLQCHNIFAHWLPGNTFVHKRHEIFRSIDDGACVFSFDDDVRYDPELIRGTMEAHARYPLSAMNYESYSEHRYDGEKILYKNFLKYKEPSIRVRWCGQSMIPAYMYPVEALSPENMAVRDRASPICDESWLTPWIVHSRVKVYNQRFGWGTDIDPAIDHKRGLCEYSRQVVDPSRNMNRRDLWLKAVLEAYPEFMEDYRGLFGYGER